MIVYTYYVGGFYPADCRGLTETPNDDNECREKEIGGTEGVTY